MVLMNPDSTAVLRPSGERVVGSDEWLWSETVLHFFSKGESIRTKKAAHEIITQHHNVIRFLEQLWVFLCHKIKFRCTVLNL